MRSRLESALSVVLTVAAVVIASSIAKRELFSGRPTTPPQNRQPVSALEDWPEVLAVARVIGDSAAVVTIAEFSDFECPFCRRFHETWSTISGKYGADVSLAYIHYPLPMHRFARPAARASECAASQGEFNRMHDILFTNQDSLGLRSWESMAAEAGVADLPTFSRCMKASDPLPSVEAGVALAKALGVKGTPTVIINGMRFIEPPSIPVLTALIDSIIAARRPLTRGL